MPERKYRKVRSAYSYVNTYSPPKRYEVSITQRTKNGGVYHSIDQVETFDDVKKVLKNKGHNGERYWVHDTQRISYKNGNHGHKCIAGGEVYGYGNKKVCTTFNNKFFEV